jgi:polyhydroxybutyrate depolymerase
MRVTRVLMDRPNSKAMLLCALAAAAATASAPQPSPAQRQPLPAMNATGARAGRAPSRSDMVEFVRAELRLNATLSHAAVLAEARRRVDLGPGPRPASPSSVPSRPRAGAAASSPGCGRLPPASGVYDMPYDDPVLGVVTRSYHLHVPRGYDPDRLHPLVLDFHPWGWSAEEQREANGMDRVADVRSAIVVYPEGLDDTPDEDGSYSWNACGATTWRDSALGPTCQWATDPSVPPAGYPCHLSCRALHGCEADDTEAAACDCASCADDSGFVLQLLERVEALLCVDPTRIHAAGYSNGAIMTYEAATGRNEALSRRLASIAPAAGAPLMGFAGGPPPQGAVAVMDMRGVLDNTCPANVSNGWPAPWLPGEPGPHGSALSGDGFFYSPIDNVTAAWASSLGCANSTAGPVHYPTRFDGIESFYCVSPYGRDCGGEFGDIVRCYHSGGHAWPFTIALLLGRWWYAELVFDFFEAHPKAAPPPLVADLQSPRSTEEAANE